MRKKIEIDLATQTVKERWLEGPELTEAGRFLIGKLLLERKIYEVDPLSDENPLIFSAGPFAGTNFSNANRLSVGCRSPLTGGIKESNSGGTFAYAMGQLEINTIIFNGAFDDWKLIHITRDGNINFLDASNYVGMANFEAAEKLHGEFGDKTSLGLCGPVGERGGLLAGIAFSDTDNRPSRISARGGVGAVMGAKKIKAIIIDKHKMPPMKDRKKLMGAVKTYGKLLGESVPVQNFETTGTAMVADLTNHMGALPTNNFSAGQVAGTGDGPFKMGGDFIREQNKARGGQISHACMPGCLIKCSNVYVDENGKEIVSPLEYETIGLLGTNCGLTNPDDVARLNEIANDLGVDTIELGATLAVLMEAGEAEFGDIDFLNACLDDLRKGNERGQLIASGTARVGRALGVTRVPVIKNQAISAYDPRIIEVTGISMMVTAQGADHTTGNAPSYKCDDKTIDEIAEESMRMQMNCAVADSLGLCIFGRSVTDENLDLIADAINGAFDLGVDRDFIRNIGARALKMEREFNQHVGFETDDNELPAFFTSEPLPPTGKTARLVAAEVTEKIDALIDSGRIV